MIIVLAGGCEDAGTTPLDDGALPDTGWDAAVPAEDGALPDGGFDAAVPAEDGALPDGGSDGGVDAAAPPDAQPDAAPACTSEEDCDDGSECANASCTPEGTCEYVPDHGACPDDNECGTPICDPFEGCGFEPVREEEPCDDGTGVCEAGTCVEVECAGGDTHLFVMSALGMGSIVDIDVGIAPGFDLDGNTDLEELTCPGPDPDMPQGTRDPWNPLFHWPDLDGTPGINNGLAASQLGELMPSLLDSMVPDAILAGDLLVLIQIEHVDDFTHDGCVKVSWLLGAVPEGVESPEAYLDEAGDGVIDAHVVLDVLSDSYDMEGEPLITAEGAIIDGSLELEVGEMTLDLGDFVFDLDASRLRFRPSSSGLDDGLLGGASSISDLAAALGEALPESPSEEDLYPYADFDYLETEDRCTSMSMGFTLEAVPAVMGVVR